MPRSPSKVKMALACGEPYRIVFQPFSHGNGWLQRFTFLGSGLLEVVMNMHHGGEGRAYSDLD